MAAISVVTVDRAKILLNRWGVSFVKDHSGSRYFQKGDGTWVKVTPEGEGTVKLSVWKGACDC
ncbi:MAG: hypothetical protein Q7R39_04560 [Dehalococcoidia bacterium]|nr:hypothetical protein [Dehalococcoidia bacterium]